MDLLAVAAVAREIEAALAGAVLRRVVQTAPEALVLEWWLPGRGEARLVASAEPEAPRLHLTAESPSTLRELPPPPGGPPRFAAWLRAHAKGARLIGVTRSPADRIVTLRLGRLGRAMPATGPERVHQLDLVVELTGTHAQLVAVDADGRVREVLRRSGAAGGRRLTPGEPYAPPPAGDRRPLGELPRLLAEEGSGGQVDLKALPRRVAGLTPPLVAHLAASAGEPGGPGRLAAAAADLAARVAEGRFAPRIYRMPGRAPLLAMVPLAHLEPAPGRAADGVEVVVFESPSAAVEAAHGSAAERLARRAAPLRARLLRGRERLARRLAALDGDRAGLERAVGARRLGDLMAAQRDRLVKGQREARLVDLFDPAGGTVTVALDPALDPQGNIEAYYARARKARRGLEAVEARRASTAAELAYLDEALFALETAEEPGDIEALEAELAEQGALGTGPATGGRRPGSARQPRGGRAPEAAVRRFRSSDGFEIVAGKTSAANDWVSTRLARPDDLWLHAEGYPGAHVVVRRAGRAEVPERTVLEAAAIAALYSRARGAGRVSVHVAPASSVRKPKGAPPGLVTLAGGHRSVAVAPDPELAARLAAPAGGG